MLYVNIISFRTETLFCWSVSSEWREREGVKMEGRRRGGRRSGERQKEGEESEGRKEGRSKCKCNKCITLHVHVHAK